MRRKTNNQAKKRQPPKLEKTVKEDLIAENQRLKMENEYKKTHSLSSIRRRERKRQKAKIISG